MTIGIASPVSCYYLQDYLFAENVKVARSLSNHDAPAVTNLVISFLQKGYGVVIFTKDPETKKNYTLRGPKLSIHVVSSYNKGWRKIWNKLLLSDFELIYKMWFSKERVDVMSVHWTRDYSFGARRFINQCPVTVTVRDIIPIVSKMQHIRWITKLWNHLAMREIKFNLIANSDYTKEMIKHFWHRDSRVIYNGISDLFLNYQSDKMFTKFTYVCISSVLDDTKNVRNLIEAFRYVHRQEPLTQLLLVGPCFEENNKIVNTWKIEGLLEGVVLMGRKNRKELKTLLIKSNCLVHPSLQESFGNVLIEAMACKCLTIGGDKSGAVPYVLKQGELGLLCDVYNPKDIAEKMLLAYQGNYSAMIEKAFDEVHDTFSPEKVSLAYISYFNELISKYK